MNTDGEIHSRGLAALSPHKEVVPNEFPRLCEDDRFSFSCHPDLECFGHCCGDVTIVLSPYDILRMKKALHISSQEFLGRYTFVPFQEGQRLPIVMLRMMEGKGRRCPFTGEAGCSIYQDRPWACRMYPLGIGLPKNAQEQGESFYFLMNERPCDGLDEPKSQTVREWLEYQGLSDYNRLGEEFKDITLHDYFIRGFDLDPRKMEMFYMACYDLDSFRRFVFESTFLDSFEIRANEVESIRADDVALMRFAFRWLRFCLFGEPTMAVREKIVKKRIVKPA